MAACGRLWLYMAVWLYVVVYGCIRLYMAVYGRICCARGCLWLYMGPETISDLLPNTEEMLRQQVFRLSGHVARMGNDKLSKQLMFAWVDEGERQLVNVKCKVSGPASRHPQEPQSRSEHVGGHSSGQEPV